jgi:two-component system chemotaxis response regulator CheB
MKSMIVIGCSSGGLHALKRIFASISAGFPLPFATVQHLSSESSGALAGLLAQNAQIPVKEAEDKEPVQPGTVYLAPAGYHLLIEADATFSLSVDEKENYSRPSIDTLFESAADVYGARLTGVILSGSNSDGARGLAKVQARGGYTIVQDPGSAEAGEMPLAALKACTPDQILPLEKIGPFLNSLGKR